MYRVHCRGGPRPGRSISADFAAAAFASAADSRLGTAVAAAALVPVQRDSHTAPEALLNKPLMPLPSPPSDRVPAGAPIRPYHDLRQGAEEDLHLRRLGWKQNPVRCAPTSCCPAL